jgi:hypothetical protein
MTTFIGIMIMGAIYLVLGMVVASYKEAFKAYILAIIGTLLVTAASYMMINYNIPSALDVYRNKTELKITSVNGVPQDIIVVYKK